jgi:hypothetical protein
MRVQAVQNDRTSLARSAMEISVGYCSIFLTEDGHLASLMRFDRNPQPGDVMVAVQGAPSPLLLRPSNHASEYKYLGYCHCEEFEYNERLFSIQNMKQFVLV